MLQYIICFSQLVINLNRHTSSSLYGIKKNNNHKLFKHNFCLGSTLCFSPQSPRLAPACVNCEKLWHINVCVCVCVCVCMQRVCVFVLACMHVCVCVHVCI